MRPLALLVLCAAPLFAEDPAPPPERRSVPVAGAGAEDLAKTFAELRTGAVKGVPEGWDTAGAVGKDPFFQALSQLEGFKSGERSALIVDGEFKGLQITHDGKTFLYKPPQPFAAQVPKEGEVAQTVLGLSGGRAVERKIDTLSPQEQAAARNNVTGAGRLVLGNADRAFDGSALRGDGVFLGGKRVADQPASADPAKPFKAVERPKGEKLAIVNEYKGALPAELKPGQVFWDGKTLMAAEAGVDGGGVRARAVGYMADMKGDTSGDMVFWHGGAVPDPKGSHAAARENWALLYIPKLEKHMEVVEGNNTAHHVAQYVMMDLSRGKVLKTADGPRMDLASALQDQPIVWRLPPADEKLRNSLDKPETKSLFRYGAPLTTKDKSFQSFIDMRGNTYQEQERGGQKFIVRTGTLFNIKEPKSHSDRPASSELAVPLILAPVERVEPPKARPDPLAGFDKVLGGEVPSYLERAAKTLAYDDLSPAMVKHLTEQRRGLEIASVNNRAEKFTPRAGPGGFGSANAGLAAIKRLQEMDLSSSDDKVRRTRLLQGALSSPEPEVRQAAAEALAASGEYGRDARHALAATALLDLNPLVRSAAALALPKVDPSHAEDYRILPEFPKTPPPTPKPVYGPQAPAKPLPQRESDLVATLKLPHSPERDIALQAHVVAFWRMNPNSLEAERARNELSSLLNHPAPLTRGQAANALIRANPAAPDPDAVRTLTRFLAPESKDIDPQTRISALSTFSALKQATPEMVRAFQATIENTRDDKSVRHAAFLYLYAFHPNQAERDKLMAYYREKPETRDVAVIPPPQRQEPAELFPGSRRNTGLDLFRSR